MTTATLTMTIDAALQAAIPQDAAEPEDHRLAREAAAGDAAAFERLYRLNVDRIHGLCLRLCHGDVARAEQATQDAFVRAWEKLGSFRAESRFSTWLHRLTVNVVLGEHRLLKRWVQFDEELPPTAIGDDDGPEACSPETAMKSEDLGSRIDLERALARLPKGARTVLILYDVEGYQHDEISALTGIAVGTSKAQLHRARRLLQAMLA